MPSNKGKHAKKTQQQLEPVILWGTRFSPYVRKVMIALGEQITALYGRGWSKKHYCIVSAARR